MLFGRKSHSPSPPPRTPFRGVRTARSASHPTTSCSAPRWRDPSRRPRGHHVRHGLLLGRRADLLGDPRRLRHRRRLPGRLHPQPDVRGDLHRSHRPHRGRPGRLRPGDGRSRGAAQGVLGEPRPDHANRQGNDIGTQYRSAIYPTTDAQLAAVEESRARYQQALKEAGFGEIATEIEPAAEAGPFYYAEDYHQGYLHKNPRGYCNHGFCQVAYNAAAHGQDAPTKVQLPEA